MLIVLKTKGIHKMRKYIFFGALATISLIISGIAYSASFDCSKAGTPFERTICSNPNLSSMDENLAQLYFSAKATTSNPDQFKSDQIAWIKSTRACETDVRCIENAYRVRMAQLTPQQPTPAPVQAPITQQTNPQVEACVMRKVNGYRSQMGQNVPADVLVEYESDCEVNPSQKEPELVESSAQSNNNFTQPISNSNSLGAGAIIFWLIVVASLGGLIGTKQGRGFIKNYVKNYIDKNRRWDPNSPEFFKKLKEDREAHLNPSLKDKAIYQMLKREYTKWSVESEDMNIASDDDFSRELRDWFEFQRENQNITMDDIRNEVPGKTEELETALNKIIACRHNPKEYEQAFIEYALTVVKGVRALTVPGARPKTERAKEIAQAADKQRKEVWAANDVYREKQAAIDKENKRASDIQNHNSSVEYTKNQLQWAKNSGNQVDINRYQAELDALNAKKF